MTGGIRQTGSKNNGAVLNLASVPLRDPRHDPRHDIGATAERLLNKPTPIQAIKAEAATAESLLAQNETCVLQVRFNALGPGYFHSYLITSDADNTRYFRGGPGRLPSERPDIGRSGTLISGVGGAASQSSGTDEYTSNNSGNSVSAGSGPGGANKTGLFGAIEVDTGRYEPTAVDWTTEQVPSIAVAVTPGNCDTLESTLARMARDISGFQIPYNPLTSNSNAVTRELLESAGFSDTNPPVWAPGWGTRLGRE